MKKNRLISLLLALVLCVSLAAPALAAEDTTKVIVDGCFQITMDGFLRVETNRYYSPTLSEEFGEWGTNFGHDYTFYVVKDNSTVTVEAAPGYHYAADPYGHESGAACYAPSGCDWLETNQQFSRWGVGHLVSLTEPRIFTVSPSEHDIAIPGGFGVHWICESDFARLVSYPYHGVPLAAPWAHSAVEHSFNLGLFPDGLDPFEDNCTREMTRGEFAAALFKLYKRLGGSVSGLSRNTPFTDLPSDPHGAIPLAYALGLVEGTGETSFSPNDPLTREQAAVMLSHIFTKFGYDITQIDVTYFDDDDLIDPEAKSAVDFLDERGIVVGVGGWNFAPQRILTIQEGMTMIQRALDTICFDRYYDFE